MLQWRKRDASRHKVMRTKGESPANAENGVRQVLNECKNWAGALSTNGYGRVWFNGKMRQAHRVAWEQHNQASILPGFVAMHKCDNRACVNPDHITLGTQAANMRDMGRKGRQHSTYLSAEQALAIRILGCYPEFNYVQIAKLFNITPSPVAAICKFTTWRFL